MTEDVAISFSKFALKVEIWETARETQEETLQETICLDMSSLLFPASPIEVSREVDKV